jgi:hypothetical protein
MTKLIVKRWTISLQSSELYFHRMLYLRWVTSGTTQVDQSTLSEQDDSTTGRHVVLVNLGLDVGSLDCVLLDPVNVDLAIKVTDAVMGWEDDTWGQHPPHCD